MSIYAVETETQDGTPCTVHVEAETRSSARYSAWHETGASDCDIPYMAFARRVKSIRKVDRIPPTKGQQQADEWNALHPVGTAVVYWTGFREGPGVRSKTRAPARAISPSHGSVHVVGHSSCIALSHVEPIDPTVEVV